ncbi:MAG: lytic transglycosylase [Deltaproteobacteria bacterium HGW-Deltaproteobacteria-6]|jgi:soluble lytic murein transglycosylase-like protein|nr:MAG: lytic transglycosylase [Deltaproteobacteria bacterium HGW-Deltaproteobacteria-6]
MMKKSFVQIPAFFLGLFCVLFLCPSYAGADVYQYVDDQRVIHLTNVPSGSNYRVLIRERSLRSSLLPDSGPLQELVNRTAGKYGIDSDLVYAVIKTESNFNAKAVSRKGAKGLMQLMPGTAASLGVMDCFHPGDNIDGGIRYLSYLINLYAGDLSLALAAYNAGEGAVAKYGGIPPYAETKSYVRLVLANYERYRRKTAGRP